MAGHVCCKNDPNEALAECFIVIAREILKEVEIGLIQDTKRLSSVVIFLNRLVTVADGAV